MNALRYTLLILTLLLFIPPVSVSAQAGTLVCSNIPVTVVYTENATYPFIVEAGGTLVLGSTSLFTRDYYFIAQSPDTDLFRVQILDVVNSRDPYTPLLGMYGAMSAESYNPGDPETSFLIQSGYNDTYDLRIQTQFASFRVLITECFIDYATPTPTPSPSPTPPLQYPTSTGDQLLPPGLCGTPAPGSSWPTAPALAWPSSTPTTGTPGPGGWGGPGLMSFYDDSGFGGGGGGGALLGVTPAAVNSFMCDDFSAITSTYDFYNQYADLVPSAVKSIESSLGFEQRTCYVLVPLLEIPDIPPLGVSQQTLFPGLQVCVNFYIWRLRYDGIALDAIIMSLITFSVAWALFVMFRRG